MGLLILIVTGAAIGWLATVMTDAASRQRTANKLFAGIAGAIALGVPMNGRDIMVGIKPDGLAVSAPSEASIVIAVYRHLRKAQIG